MMESSSAISVSRIMTRSSACGGAGRRGAERIRHASRHRGVSPAEPAFQFCGGARGPNHRRRIVRPRWTARLPASSGGGQAIPSAGNWPATGKCLCESTSKGRHFKMQHFHLRQQCGRHEILGAGRLEAAHGITCDANPPGPNARLRKRLPVLISRDVNRSPDLPRTYVLNWPFSVRARVSPWR